MSEQHMRGRVVRALMPKHAIAVENPALPGTPDVNYLGGWIELKCLRSWPARAETLVAIDTFTPQQRIWHIRRRMAGGTSWMLIQCGRDWLLLDGADAALNIGLCTKQQLIDLSAGYSDHGLDQEELISWISRKQKVFTFSESAKAKLNQMLQKGTMFPSTGI